MVRVKRSKTKIAPEDLSRFVMAQDLARSLGHPLKVKVQVIRMYNLRKVNRRFVVAMRKQHRRKVRGLI